MNRRFLALLLMLVLGLQSVAPAFAADEPASPAAHCGEASTQHHDMSKTDAASGHECPHCSGDALDAGDCASYCAAAVAPVPAVFSITRFMPVAPAAREFAPLVSHVDIPPTPPPIA